VLCWLALAALPRSNALPVEWHAAVAQWGRLSVLILALALLDTLQDLPLSGSPPVNSLARHR